MLVAELQELEEVKGLITRGQQLGVLTFGDIASAVSEVDLDESDVEDLHGFFEKSATVSFAALYTADLSLMMRAFLAVNDPCFPAVARR